MKKRTLISLLILLSICFIQSIKAIENPQPIGFVQFSYVAGIEEPIIYFPFGGGYLSIPASAVVYDDRAVIITFFCTNGSADAELCDGDIVVGTWHKPSGTQTMTIRLPVIPGDYTIYLYLQNGTILYGEYTLE